MNIIRSIGLFVVVYVLYMLAGLIYPGGGAWYESLAKPPGTPPGPVFGIVWGILYALIALSFVIVTVKKQRDELIFGLFAVNWFLNQAFTYLFFGKQNLFAGALDTALLWLSTLLLILVIRKRNPLAAWLLVPYLLWVSYATYLSWGIYLLNR